MGEGQGALQSYKCVFVSSRSILIPEMPLSDVKSITLTKRGCMELNTSEKRKKKEKICMQGLGSLCIRKQK